MYDEPRRWAHSTEERIGVEKRGYVVIGGAIKDDRLRAGLTQRQLETLTGIDQTVISRLENGKQYGLRWSRYAILIGVLSDRVPPRPKPEPWWATLGRDPRPGSSSNPPANPVDAPDRHTD